MFRTAIIDPLLFRGFLTLSSRGRLEDRPRFKARVNKQIVIRGSAARPRLDYRRYKDNASKVEIIGSPRLEQIEYSYLVY
jgi:hypothetical protein